MGQEQSTGRKTRRSGKGTYTQNVENINSNNENENENIAQGAPSFDYIKKVSSAANIGGVFAFSLYFRDFGEDYNISEIIDHMNYSPYLEGLSLYAKAIEKEESVFSNWRIILYINRYTYDKIKEASENSIQFNELYNIKNLEIPIQEKIEIHKDTYNPLTDKNTDLVIVDWPYYDLKSNGLVDGYVMRCMRFRAFFDYPTIPVFVRDADTLFATSSIFKTTIRMDARELYEWEKNFYLEAQKYPNTYIFGTGLGSKAPWHRNFLEGIEAPVGAYAGFQSVIPTVPCFQTEDLWQRCINYIQAHSHRVKKNGKISLSAENVINNNGNTHSIKVGKDEQLLLFVILPQCIQHVFFFDLDLRRIRRYTLGDKVIYNLNYPSYILQRGSNAQLKELLSNYKKNKGTIQSILNSMIENENKKREEKEKEKYAQQGGKSRSSRKTRKQRGKN